MSYSMKKCGYEIYIDEYERLVDLTEFGCPPPTRAYFNKFPVTYSVQSGFTVGDGKSEVTWEFDIIPKSAWIVLVEDVLGGRQSYNVTFTTSVPDSDVFCTFTAIMHRPSIPNEARPDIGGFLRDVTIRFTYVEPI